MSTNQIHVFISHSWSHSDHYDTLARWFFAEDWSVGQASLDFRDYSVPRNDPIHNAPTAAALQRAIFDKIGRSHVVVIPTGMYASQSKWIQKEIDGSNSHGKPILAVDLWGHQRTASVVRNNAARSVGWNKKSIVKAAWELFRS